MINMNLSRAVHMLKRWAVTFLALLFIPVFAGNVGAVDFPPGQSPHRDMPIPGEAYPPPLPPGNVDLSLVSYEFRNAYTLGVQSFVFCFPYLYNALLRWQIITQEPEDPDNIPYIPLNYFWHSRQLSEGGTGGSPNNDTLYSVALVDVSEEPFILSHPDIPGNRYFSFQIAGFDSDNFAYVGTRTTGQQGGSFALIGPEYVCRNPSGKVKRPEWCLPPDVTLLPRSKTNTIIVLARIFVEDTDDVTNVHVLQDQIELTPLSLWGTGIPVPEDRDVLQPFPLTDPLGRWKTINAVMEEFPEEPRHRAMLNWFKSIGIGRGADPEDMSQDVKNALALAWLAGYRILDDAATDGVGSIDVNNWFYPPEGFGRSGVYDDYLLRAATQSLAGIIANDAEEAVYIINEKDGNDNQLKSSLPYTVRFAPGDLPDVDAFWSLTMYSSANFDFVSNPIDRYKINDQTPGIEFDPDGGLTIYIQNTPPVGHESNWLPSEAGNKDFYLIIRAYLPGPSLVNATWVPPSVVLTGP